MNTIKQNISNLLITTENAKNVDILYACESGSRAWGFASPNSDYDIRFLYLNPQEFYLSVFEHKDTIEIPIKDDLDPGGWDVKKALSLLAKSNGALIEWLHSPIIYQDKEGFRDRWQKLALDVLNPNHLVNHYKGLASQIRQRKLQTDEPSAKGYLYACRALLAAKWVTEKFTPPPVPFAELLDFASPKLKAILQETVEWKATADEIASRGRLDLIEQFISAELDQRKSSDALPAPKLKDIQKCINEEYRFLINL